MSTHKIKRLIDSLPQSIDYQSKYWKDEEVVFIYDILNVFSLDEWQILERNFQEFDENYKKVIFDILICAVEGYSGFEFYDFENFRTNVWKVLSEVRMKFTHPKYRNWSTNYKTYSNTQSQNQLVLELYYFILKNLNHDGDFWNFGGMGDWEIQKILLQFDNETWQNLTFDIIYWEQEEIDILLESITDSETLPEFYKNESNVQFIWTFMTSIHNSTTHFDKLNMGAYASQFIISINEKGINLNSQTIMEAEQWFKINFNKENQIHDTLDELKRKNR